MKFHFFLLILCTFLYIGMSLTDWNRFVGMKGEEVKNEILRENPDLNVVILSDKSPVTRDLRMDRVRIFINDDGIVLITPRLG